MKCVFQRMVVGNKVNINPLKFFLRLVGKGSSQQKAVPDFNNNEVDQLIQELCNELDSSLKGVDGKTAAARFPDEEKTKILSIMRSKPLGKNEVKQIAEIIYMNYLDMSKKAINDYSDIIEEHIQNNHLKDTKHPYIFIHDETENKRKFWLKNGKFNDDGHKNFVLGGIVYDEEQFDGNTDCLFASLRLPPSLTDLKAKNILKSQEIKVWLKEKNLTTFLRWLYEKEVYVHYWNVDTLFLVAIQIAEVITEEDEPRELYNDILYRTIKKDTTRVAELLHRYVFPNVKDERLEAFWGELLQLFEELNKDIPPIQELIHNPVREKLLEAKHMKKRLESDHDDYIIIKDFSAYYKLPFLIFSESFHVFDEEMVIKKELQDHPLERNYKEIQNYKFENSKFDRRIQVSDVVVGCLGKFFTFLKNTEGNDLMPFLISLDDNQKLNLALLCEILRKSFMRNPAFTSTISSFTEKINLESLMEIFSLDGAKSKYVYYETKVGIHIVPTEPFSKPLKSLFENNQ